MTHRKKLDGAIDFVYDGEEAIVVLLFHRPQCTSARELSYSLSISSNSVSCLNSSSPNTSTNASYQSGLFCFVCSKFLTRTRMASKSRFNLIAKIIVALNSCVVLCYARSQTYWHRRLPLSTRLITANARSFAQPDRASKVDTRKLRLNRCKPCKTRRNRKRSLHMRECARASRLCAESSLRLPALELSKE